MKLLNSVICISIITSTVSCATVNPLNDNCVVVSVKKVQDKDITPGSGTKNGAITGLGSGILIGGLLGLGGGGITGGVVYVFTLGTAPQIIPLFMIAGAVVGIIGGGLIGLGIGAASGYGYDYIKAGTGVYQYNIACSQTNGFYKVESGSVVFESNSITNIPMTMVLQADDKPIESGTAVDLYFKNNGYYIKPSLPRNHN